MLQVIINKNGNEVVLEKQVKELIKQIKTEKAHWEKVEKEMNEALIEAMKNNNVTSISSDDLLVTYKSPTYRESFDTKKFKEEHEDLYNEYVRISDVKESVLVKVRD